MPAAALVAFLLTVAPSGQALAALFADAAHRLPAAPLVETATGVWMVAHAEPTASLAAAYPRQLPSASLAALRGAGPRAVLPALDLPRLLVYRPALLDRRGRPKALHQLPVDVVDHLTAGLFMLHLEHLIADPEIASVLDGRAAERFAEVPEALRGRVYRRALADFAGHAVAVANEIERAVLRRAAAGRAPPCALLDPPRALFRTWAQLFGPMPFPGEWTGLDGRPNITRAVLGAEDKAWAMEHLLGGAFRGAPSADFARYCRKGS